MRLQQRASQVLVLFGVTLIASGAFAASAPMGPPTSEGMMQLRSSRWAASSDQLLVAPYFSISDNQRVRLVLDNRFADPIDYNIRVLSSSGQALPLGGDSLPGRGVLNLDLNQTLETVAPRFREGALEVSYFGDAAMAQAWLIIENSAGVIEEPLAKPTTNQGNQWISFWDTSAVVQGRKGVLYAFHNNSTSPVTLDVSLQGSSAKPKRIHRELPPLAHRPHHPTDHFQRRAQRPRDRPTERTSKRSLPRRVSSRGRARRGSAPDCGAVRVRREQAPPRPSLSRHLWPEGRDRDSRHQDWRQRAAGPASPSEEGGRGLR